MTTDAGLLHERAELRLQAHFASAPAEVWTAFRRRLAAHWGGLHRALYALYGHRHDFETKVHAVLDGLARASAARAPELHALDAEREARPHWYHDHRAVGGVCYVDRFAGDIDGVRARIPYFRELGLTYLHLMPLFATPEGRSDGGYAVSSYRDVQPRLGTMDDLRALAAELRANGISLVLDFIYNHTSEEHVWARKARAGEGAYRDFYWFFPDRQLPDRYEQHLREVFPAESPGNFTWLPEQELWVWTTFKPYQWDLNYRNPDVLTAMAGEMLFLANTGVEVLRMDAVVFAWKEMGTVCESLPPVHTLVEAFNCMARIAAPAMVFKSEAIVHPDEVLRCIGAERCQVSYNPTLMALLWEALATREVQLLEHSMARRFAIPAATQWMNYVRCHDDIGWTFDDGDAGEIGIHGGDHRRFLNRFYIGDFEGSFSRGLPFQYNPKNGDCRVCGSTASLAGLEKALAEESDAEVELALRRILLLYSVTMSIGGVPLLYLGDEFGVLNDYSFRDHPHHHDDARWAQRPSFTDAHFAAAHEAGTTAQRLFRRFVAMIHLRKVTPAFGGHDTRILRNVHPRVLAYVREHDGQRALVLNNFSEQALVLPGGLLPAHLGVAVGIDTVVEETLDGVTDIDLSPYQFRWISPAP